MTRTEQLTEKIETIYRANKSEIDALPQGGPQGGTNAAYIEGWICLGNGTITRAANLSSLPVLPYWSGPSPTPSSSIPECVSDEIEKTYKSIFGA